MSDRPARVIRQSRSTQRHPPVVPDVEPRSVDRIDRVSHDLWALRISTDHGAPAGVRLAGESQTRTSACGGERATECCRNSQNGAVCGLRMARTFANVLRIGTTSGRMTSWRIALQDGRPLKLLTSVEEYSRECLAIVVARGLRSIDVLETLACALRDPRRPGPYPLRVR